MSFQNFERGYRLPAGCKDLSDAIKLEAEATAKASLGDRSQAAAIKGEVSVSEQTTIRELADLLGEKPFKIIADAMDLGIFPGVNQALGLEVITQIARKYGYTAVRKT